jgi:hypothetical protein
MRSADDRGDGSFVLFRCGSGLTSLELQP